MSSLFERSIETLRGVGQKRGVLFRKLGVPTVGNLLELYPRAYEDWSGVPILETTLEQVCTVRATVCDPPTEHRIRGGRLLYKVKVTDGSDDMALTFFNNRYIPTLLKAGQEYLFHGKVQGNLTRREMLSPQFTPADRARPIVPVYPATAGLTSRQISAAVAEALQLLPETVSDPLPLELRERFHLCHLNFALEHGVEGLTDTDLTAMLRFANAAAYIVTTRKGAIRSMPERAEVEALLPAYEN